MLDGKDIIENFCVTLLKPCKSFPIASGIILLKTDSCILYEGRDDEAT